MSLEVGPRRREDFRLPLERFRHQSVSLFDRAARGSSTKLHLHGVPAGAESLGVFGGKQRRTLVLILSSLIGPVIASRRGLSSSEVRCGQALIGGLLTEGLLPGRLFKSVHVDHSAGRRLGRRGFSAGRRLGRRGFAVFDRLGSVAAAGATSRSDARSSNSVRKWIIA